MAVDVDLKGPSAIPIRRMLKEGTGGDNSTLPRTSRGNPGGVVGTCGQGW